MEHEKAGQEDLSQDSLRQEFEVMTRELAAFDQQVLDGVSGSSRLRELRLQQRNKVANELLAIDPYDNRDWMQDTINRISQSTG